MPYLRSKCFKYRLICRISWRMEEALCRFVLVWCVVFLAHSASRNSNELSTLTSDNSMSAMRSLACWIPLKIFPTSTDRSLFTKIWTWHTAYSTKRSNINSFVKLQLQHAGFSGTPSIQEDDEVIPVFLSMVRVSFPLRFCLMFKTTQNKVLTDFKTQIPGSCRPLNWAHQSSRFPVYVQVADTMD